MNLRNDALSAAAEFILATEKYAATPKNNLVATVGKISIPNAASNVIPGTVTISVDLRSDDDEYLSSAYEALYALCEKICFKRKLYFEWKLIQESKAVVCDEKMNAILAQCIADAGHEVISIISGAGHDAVPISKVAPVAMLFVKCAKGISHSPLEHVEVEDIAAALEVAENFMLNFTVA
jgi:allantoate deiminase